MNSRIWNTLNTHKVLYGRQTCALCFCKFFFRFFCFWPSNDFLLMLDPLVEKKEITWNHARIKPYQQRDQFNDSMLGSNRQVVNLTSLSFTYADITRDRLVDRTEHLPVDGTYRSLFTWPYGNTCDFSLLGYIPTEELSLLRPLNHLWGCSVWHNFRIKTG